MSTEHEKAEKPRSRGTRREFLSTVVGGVALSGSTVVQRANTNRSSSTGVKYNISFRPDWIRGINNGTRISAEGNLVLDDEVEFSDNFQWNHPSESAFEWIVRSPQGTGITPHPDSGHVSLNTSDRSGTQVIELEQNNGFYYNMNEHEDWRLNVVESNVRSISEAAWEFWFSQPPLGTDPWVLIDAGGSSQGLSERKDDECGMGFFTRRDQLLAHFSDSSINIDDLLRNPGRYIISYLTDSGYWSGGSRFATSNQCWDRFQNAPVDHRYPRKLSLELLGSDGVINGYVNNSLEANLREDHDQRVPHGERLTTGVRLHDRDSTPETGHLHHFSVQRVGKKQSAGEYHHHVETADRIDWQECKIDATVPKGTDYTVSFIIPGVNRNSEDISQLENVPLTDSLVIRISLETTMKDATPQISSLTLTS